MDEENEDLVVVTVDGQEKIVDSLDEAIDLWEEVISS